MGATAAPQPPARISPLPRGPHRLSREEVACSQRERLLEAFTQLLAERGYANVTIGDLVRQAGVSRATFYEHFADKEECMFTAYERFTERLAAAVAPQLGEPVPVDDLMRHALTAYLGALQQDLTAARAFIVEMDAAGPVARSHRREGVRLVATLFERHHAHMRELNPKLKELPETAYVGTALGVRELVHRALDEQRNPQLTDLVPELVDWIAATVRGAL